jgi:hypothetical protein
MTENNTARPDGSTTMTPRLRAPWRGALVIGGLLGASSAFQVSPLWDAVTALPVPFAEQVQPWTYLLVAPLFGVWDTLSLLTLTQHYAVLATLVAIYVSVRTRAPRGVRPIGLRVILEAARAVGAFACLLAFYAAGVAIPRPMTAIRLTDSDLLAIDFHSHTRYSHDGWEAFTAARNREWHESGGFDVGYVTDHYTWQGFDDAAVNNPVQVGERTALLSGAEIRIHGRPTNILGDRERYQFALDTLDTYLDPDSVAAGFVRDGRRPTLLYTMPGRLNQLIAFSETQPSGMIGIELNDGSPRGLEQVKSERAEIIALADSMDLALLGAANLHGWGRTVASWSIMRVPGWQQMTPPALADVIEEQLHDMRREAVVVVERRMPYHGGSTLKMVMTLPWLAWEHLRMLSWPERLSWLLWVGALAAVRSVLSGRNRGGESY